MDFRFGRRYLVAALGALAAGVVFVGTAAALGRDEGHQVFLNHPDWLLPAWTAGGPAAWTMVGPPYGGAVTLIGADSSFAPRNHGPSISVWLDDLDAGRLRVAEPHAWRFQLNEEALPIVTSVWDVDDLHVETTFFASWPGADLTPWFAQRGAGADRAVTFIRLQVSTTASGPRHLAAYLALRPFGVEPDMHPIGAVSCDPATSTLIADGAVVLTGLQPADSCGASSLGRGEVATVAARGRVPSTTAITDDAQRAEGILRLGLVAAATAPARLEFRAPLSARPPRPDVLAALVGGAFEDERAKVAAAWQPVLGRVALDVPDSRANAAFRTSQMYLLLNRHGDLPRSGPLAHDAFWVRDAAYIGETLERVGDGQDNQATLEALLALQRDDGSLPAITDAAGPRPVDEWDAPGEAITSVVGHYRFTHDRAWLERVYPKVWRAAQFQDALRGRTLAEGPETASLLPANLSAEDLGLASWHHYWDDLWAIAGYREAAFAASELGRTDEAAQLASRAEDLQAALLRSIELVEARTGRAFVPNGPEDVLSSAMARGTTPALWPVHALQGAAADDLLARSFRSYDAAWLAPQGGGYRHYQGTLWPYGGLGIAHAMLRLGMLQQVWQILDWTLSHQTLPGTYAWGEAINPSNGGLELGDMPHSWAAAELVSLVRDMLLSEQDGALLVNGGTPDTWLDPGGHVLLRDAPTHYGPATIELRRADAPSMAGMPNSAAAPTDLTISLSGTSPRGWRVRIPANGQRVVIDDGSPLLVSGTTIDVPSGVHTLRVIYAPDKIPNLLDPTADSTQPPPLPTSIQPDPMSGN